MATVDLLTLLAIIVVYSQLNDANNVCYVEESGCKFRVTVLPMSSCPANHVNDQPRATQVSMSVFCHPQKLGCTSKLHNFSCFDYFDGNCAQLSLELCKQQRTRQRLAILQNNNNKAIVAKSLKVKKINYYSSSLLIFCFNSDALINIYQDQPCCFLNYAFYT